MKAKILVTEVPFDETFIDFFNEIFDDDFLGLGTLSRPTPHKDRACCQSSTQPCCFSEPTTTCDCFREKPKKEWGIAGEPADENKRFGAEFAVDEPRARDYENRWKFESDHSAYDRFVEVGEDCAARGMLRPEGVETHRVNAIRKRIEDGPVFGLDLIGETDWF